MAPLRHRTRFFHFEQRLARVAGKNLAFCLASLPHIDLALCLFQCLTIVGAQMPVDRHLIAQ